MIAGYGKQFAVRTVGEVGDRWVARIDRRGFRWLKKVGSLLPNAQRGVGDFVGVSRWGMFVIFRS